MIKESAVVAKVKKLFKDTFPGCEVCKIHVSPRHNRGFPDLLIVTEYATFFIEVKRPGNKPTDLQRSRLKSFQDSGKESVVCYWVDCDPQDNKILRFKNPDTDEVECTVRL